MRGHTRHPSDMLTAATALVHGVPLATRNPADFTFCGITLINPFVPGVWPIYVSCSLGWCRTGCSSRRHRRE